MRSSSSRSMRLALTLFALISSAAAAAATAAAAAAAATTTTPTTAKKNAHIQSLPLIPHHSHEARRRHLSGDSITTTSTASSTATSTNSNSSYNRRRTDAIQLGALYQGYGTHYIDLWVGTPPQRQTLIVDTGSGVTAFPCSECDPIICGKGHHIDDFFDETASSSYEKISCEDCQRGHCSSAANAAQAGCKMGMSYQEGSSWSAFEVKDQVYIGGPHDHGLTGDNGGSSDLDPGHAYAFSFPMTFGCQTKITGLFKTQLADGIMGMDDATTAFWAQMYEAGIITDKQFSLCFTRQPLADRKGTEAGAMTMGGYDDRLHSSPMIYTGRYGNGGGFYNVHVRKVYVRHGSGGEMSQSSDPKAQVIELQISEDTLNHGNVIVDSGTTDTYFTRRIATEFNNAWKELSGRAYSHAGVSLTEKELRALPTILIQLAGDEAYNKQLYPKHDVPGLAGAVDPDHPFDVLLAIPPSHYMEYDDKSKNYVARFYTEEGGGSVLGANVMMGHDVYFDLDDKRIGWAESDCDYHELITTIGGFVDTLDEATSTSVKPETPTTDDKQTTPDAADNMDNPPQDDAMHSSPRIHPAIDACNDTACRGAVTAVMMGFLAIGLAIGRGSSRSSSGKGRFHDMDGELELMTAADGMYRDDPENFDMDDDVAAFAASAGTRYKQDG